MYSEKEQEKIICHFCHTNRIEDQIILLRCIAYTYGKSQFQNIWYNAQMVI